MLGGFPYQATFWGDLCRGRYNVPQIDIRDYPLSLEFTSEL